MFLAFVLVSMVALSAASHVRTEGSGIDASALDALVPAADPAPLSHVDEHHSLEPEKLKEFMDAGTIQQTNCNTNYAINFRLDDCIPVPNDSTYGSVRLTAYDTSDTSFLAFYYISPDCAQTYDTFEWVYSSKCAESYGYLYSFAIAPAPLAAPGAIDAPYPTVAHTPVSKASVKAKASTLSSGVGAGAVAGIVLSALCACFLLGMTALGKWSTVYCCETREPVFLAGSQSNDRTVRNDRNARSEAV